MHYILKFQILVKDIKYKYIMSIVKLYYNNNNNKNKSLQLKINIGKCKVYFNDRAFEFLDTYI